VSARRGACRIEQICGHRDHRDDSFVRYFFYVMGPRWPIRDDQGTPFPDASEAVALAKIMANDLAQDEDQYLGHVVTVVDEQENLISRIPIVRRTN
jgi:hypothetical protein